MYALIQRSMCLNPSLFRKAFQGELWLGLNAIPEKGCFYFNFSLCCIPAFEMRLLEQKGKGRHN